MSSSDLVSNLSLPLVKLSWKLRLGVSPPRAEEGREHWELSVYTLFSSTSGLRSPALRDEPFFGRQQYNLR